MAEERDLSAGGQGEEDLLVITDVPVFMDKVLFREPADDLGDAAF